MDASRAEKNKLSGEIGLLMRDKKIDEAYYNPKVQELFVLRQ